MNAFSLARLNKTIWVGLVPFEALALSAHVFGRLARARCALRRTQHTTNLVPERHEEMWRPDAAHREDLVLTLVGTLACAFANAVTKPLPEHVGVLSFLIHLFSYLIRRFSCVRDRIFSLNRRTAFSVLSVRPNH